MTGDRPNVIVVSIDQQRWDSLGCYGNPTDLTPQLDALADRGTLLEGAYSPQPLCGPARACIQTVQHGTENGVWTNGHFPDLTTTMADVFTDAGYEAGYVGKFHLADVGTEPVPPEHRLGCDDYWRAADNMEHATHPYEGVLYECTGNSDLHS